MIRSNKQVQYHTYTQAHPRESLSKTIKVIVGTLTAMAEKTDLNKMADERMQLFVEYIRMWLK